MNKLLRKILGIRYLEIYVSYGCYGKEVRSAFLHTPKRSFHLFGPKNTPTIPDRLKGKFCISSVRWNLP